MHLNKKCLLLPFLLVWLVSCREPKPAPEPGNDTAKIVFQDATGRTISLPGPAVRIISLAPNLTEMVFAVGAGGQMTGRTKYCDYPPEAAALPVIGDMLSVDYEGLAAQKPDAVLMSMAGNTQSVYDKLLGLGMRPVAIDASTVDGTINSIDTIGMITGHSAQAARLTAGLRATVDSVRRLATPAGPVSVFVVVDNSPLMTVSRGFIAEQLAIAGGRNIAADMAETYPRYSREELLRRNPEVIIVPAPGTTAVNDLVKLYPEWRELRAVRNNRIRIVDPNIVTRPGPRIGESLRLLYQTLHQ